MSNEKIASFEELSSHLEECVNFFYQEYLANTMFIPESLHKNFKIEVNHYTLAEAIEDARVDLGRWVQFHLIGDKKPDNHKYAGFLSRWMAKRRPIQICQINECDTPHYPETLFKLNAIFALVVFRSFLKYDIPAPLVRDLVYKFHYRDPSGEALAVLAYCCEQISDVMEQSVHQENEFLEGRH